MLVVTVDLFPGGYETHRRIIGTMRISNRSNLADVSDYCVDANPLTGDPPRKAACMVLAHDRKRLLFLGPADDANELLFHFDVRTAAHAELVTAMDACRSTLMSHRTVLDEIAATLLRVGRIDGVTATAILDALGQMRGRK